MKVTIVGAGNTLGVIEDWAGPIPRAGDYIFHPPFDGQRESNVMSVKTVTWRMLTRPSPSIGHFTEHPEPCVEIHV